MVFENLLYLPEGRFHIEINIQIEQTTCFIPAVNEFVQPIKLRALGHWACG